MNDFPFYDCSQNDFINLFTSPPVAEQFNDLLSSHDFRKLLSNFTKDERLNELSCNYYTTDEFNTKFVKIKNSIHFSMLHLNIRSLNSKITAFCTMLKLLLVDFDVIVLSEIWTYNVSFYKNILADYYLFYDLPSSSSIGGVGLFVKKNLNPKIRNDLKLSTQDMIKCEYLFLELSKDKNKMIVGGVY